MSIDPNAFRRTLLTTAWFVLSCSTVVTYGQGTGNSATPVDRIWTRDGFTAELLYSVPAEKQGSWVNLCTDDKGRLLVSDQFGGLYRITPPPPGGSLSEGDIQPVPAAIRAVNGMVWEFGALYVGVNDYEQKMESGLYRITDSDGDDMLDHVEQLRIVKSRGDHGVHAVVPSPDGKSLFLITGNNTTPPELATTSPVRQVWGEDHLLPSMPDGRGHNRGVLAPGGIVYRVDPDGKNFEAYASGFRNIFDAAFNHDGDLFTWDADMEYDFNTPWYRATRICQVTSGAEFGWRNGAGKRPPFYEDNLPGVVDIGPGSPTGVTFGYGAKFPAKYQNALYALDWSWGRVYAVHLEQDGAGYRATREEFITGAPLPITDAIIHPDDGAMYFTIGGRRVQSGLYRVRYTGSEDTSPAQTVVAQNPARDRRLALEAYHGRTDAHAVADAWGDLSNSDRGIRFAARTAIEHQPVAEWQENALNEPHPAVRTYALLALTRVTGICSDHRQANSPAVNEDLRGRIIDSLLQIDVATLDDDAELALHRTLQIVLSRFGAPPESQRQALLGKLDPLFPADSPEKNWLLCETLAFLQSRTVAEKSIALMQSVPTQEEQMQYARSIRFLKEGWTTALHTQYFEWFLTAASYAGGASFEKFIEFIRNDAVASLNDQQKTELAAVLDRKPERKSVLENLGKVFAGRELHEWSLDELTAATAAGLQHRNFENGQKMFAAAGCYACHRFNNQGGMTGPDLTSAGRRYSVKDLLDQVVNPSKVINEQFAAVTVVTDDGLVHNGVVVNLNGDRLTLNTDLTNPNERVNIDRSKIEELFVSKTSPMPTGLLNRMTADEVLDLTAYLISGGDAAHQMFSSR